MQRDFQITDREFLTYTFVDCAVAALKFGWSNKAPISWTWTTRSELELLAQFYSIALLAAKKITEGVIETLFDADLTFTKPSEAAKSLWNSMELAFETPWDKTMTQRMKVAKREFERRTLQIEKALSLPKKSYKALETNSSTYTKHFGQ